MVVCDQINIVAQLAEHWARIQKLWPGIFFNLLGVDIELELHQEDGLSRLNL